MICTNYNHAKNFINLTCPVQPKRRHEGGALMSSLCTPVPWAYFFLLVNILFLNFLVHCIRIRQDFQIFPTLPLEWLNSSETLSCFSDRLDNLDKLFPESLKMNNGSIEGVSGAPTFGDETSVASGSGEAEDASCLSRWGFILDIDHPNLAIFKVNPNSKLAILWYAATKSVSLQFGKKQADNQNRYIRHSIFCSEKKNISLGLASVHEAMRATNR